MPESMPDVQTLLDAAVQYLEQALLPTLSGYHRFQTRVTVNVLNIIRRELGNRAAQDSAERDRLIAIVGHGDTLEALTEELCDLIRTGGIDLNRPALHSHIKYSLADALAINNPRWAESE
jgi:Domain of unknown function (DUF6285)